MVIKIEPTQKIALITGANKGIGFEIAKSLGLLGITVYLGSRDIERGKKAVSQLVDQGINGYLIQLDLNDKNSIKMAAEKIKQQHGVLDILINNAGIIDPADGLPSITSSDIIRHTFETNFFATLEVTQAMLPLVRESAAARIVNISSGLGSLELNQDPQWEFVNTKLIGYNTSKAALNMLTVQLAWELRNTNIKVNSANPGYTATELVPGAIGGQPIAEGAKIAVKLALLANDGPTGGFFESNGVLPW